jgi:hypothetical protein
VRVSCFVTAHPGNQSTRDWTVLSILITSLFILKSRAGKSNCHTSLYWQGHGNELWVLTKSLADESFGVVIIALISFLSLRGVGKEDSKTSPFALSCPSIASSRKKKNPPWLWSASELCRPSDRRFLAK